ISYIRCSSSDLSSSRLLLLLSPFMPYILLLLMKEDETLAGASSSTHVPPFSHGLSEQAETLPQFFTCEDSITCSTMSIDCSFISSCSMQPANGARPHKLSGSCTICSSIPPM